MGDSELVKRWKRAGLIILGKTNTPEFGLTPCTESEAFGPTRNPWDLGRRPRGLKRRFGSAVAARMVPLASGGDGGGSIRIPASACGLFGMKPSRGRTPAAIEKKIIRAVGRAMAGWLFKRIGIAKRLAAETYSFIPWTPGFNVTGQPAMSVPLCWSDNGLPIGMHFVGRFADEGDIVSAGWPDRKSKALGLPQTASLHRRRSMRSRASLQRIRCKRARPQHRTFRSIRGAADAGCRSCLSRSSLWIGYLEDRRHRSYRQQRRDIPGGRSL